MRRSGAAAVAVLLAVLSGSADAFPVRDLEMRPVRDLALTGGALAATGILYVFEDQLVPDHCRWCDRDDDGSDALNGLDESFRDRLRWCDADAADAWSDGTFALTILGAPGLAALAARRENAIDLAKRDALIVAESAAFALGLNTLVKYLAARDRPYAHDPILDPPECGHVAEDRSPDHRVSFYSAHTTMAFAAAVSAGTVSTMRGYRLAPLVWGVGLAGAATTGYLRIASDRHYFTDVAAGAATGTLIGLLVPRLLHPRRSLEDRDPGDRGDASGARSDLDPAPALDVGVDFAPTRGAGLHVQIAW